jgi:hypothetical protein
LLLTSAGPGDIDTINAKLEAATAFTDYLKANAKASTYYEIMGDRAGPVVKDWFKQIGESGSGKQDALDSIVNIGDQLAILTWGPVACSFLPMPTKTDWEVTQMGIPAEDTLGVEGGY